MLARAAIIAGHDDDDDVEPLSSGTNWNEEQRKHSNTLTDFSLPVPRSYGPGSGHGHPSDVQ